MFYYLLPNNHISGGVKVAYQFCSLLAELGVDASVATPDGIAPGWLWTNVRTVRQDEGMMKAASGLIFSFPPDFYAAKKLHSRCIYHCQGTNEALMPQEIYSDRSITILTCWQQAAEHFRARGRDDIIEVGIHISDAFVPGEKKRGQIALMPRRGMRACLPSLMSVAQGYFRPIHNKGEGEVAAIFARSEYFIATASMEYFGLPALEAMASGCKVVSVPVIGGAEYLKHGVNCMVSPPSELHHALRRLSEMDESELLRRASETAARYTRPAQKQILTPNIERIFR